MNRVEDVLLTGFKAHARTELNDKLSREEAEEMLETKYDIEAAQMMEESVTEAIGNISEIFEDLNSLKHTIKNLQD